MTIDIEINDEILNEQLKNKVSKKISDEIKDQIVKEVSERLDDQIKKITKDCEDSVSSEIRTYLINAINRRVDNTLDEMAYGTFAETFELLGQKVRIECSTEKQRQMTKAFYAGVAFSRILWDKEYWSPDEVKELRKKTIEAAGRGFAREILKDPHKYEKVASAVIKQMEASDRRH